MGAITGHFQLLMGGGAGAPTGPTPTWLSVTASTTTTNVTTHNATMPATVNAGDLLVAIIAQNSRTSVTTTPTGWALAEPMAVNSVGNISIGIYYKVADGTEGGTSVNFATSVGHKSAHHVHRIQAGTYSGTPQVANFFSTSNSANPDPPSLTPSWGSANTLWIAAAGAAVAETWSAYPFASNQTGTSVPSGDALASCTDATAGASINPGTFTMTASSSWGTYTVAISPT